MQTDYHAELKAQQDTDPRRLKTTKSIHRLYSADKHGRYGITWAVRYAFMGERAHACVLVLTGAGGEQIEERRDDACGSSQLNHHKDAGAHVLHACMQVVSSP